VVGRQSGQATEVAALRSTVDQLTRSVRPWMEASGALFAELRANASAASARADSLAAETRRNLNEASARSSRLERQLEEARKHLDALNTEIHQLKGKHEASARVDYKRFIFK